MPSSQGWNGLYSAHCHVILLGLIEGSLCSLLKNLMTAGDEFTAGQEGMRSRGGLSQSQRDGQGWKTPSCEEVPRASLPTGYMIGLKWSSMALTGPIRIPSLNDMEAEREREPRILFPLKLSALKTVTVGPINFLPNDHSPLCAASLAKPTQMVTFPECSAAQGDH